MTPPRTEVELRFKPLGPALTRVEVEHRGWTLILQRFTESADVLTARPGQPRTGGTR